MLKKGAKALRREGMIVGRQYPRSFHGRGRKGVFRAIRVPRPGREWIVNVP